MICRLPDGNAFRFSDNTSNTLQWTQPTWFTILICQFYTNQYWWWKFRNDEHHIKLYLGVSLTGRLSDGLERGLSADESLDWTVWSLSSGQCPAVHVHKKENTTSIKLENPVEDSLIHDQMISNVKFDRLIRIEIKWNKVSGKQAQLEIPKIFPEMKKMSFFLFLKLQNFDF